MGPSQVGRPSRVVQDVSWRLGRRLCLLKGCEEAFQPGHPLARYCSSACRAAALRWRRRTANRRYRASEQGKCRRRAQACRYRERLRQRQEPCSPAPEEREGYPYPPAEGDFFCQRPGCYEGFARSSRSPLQRFCSASCRQALRRVVLRERRWRRILRTAAQSRWRADDSW